MMALVALRPREREMIDWTVADRIAVRRVIKAHRFVRTRQQVSDGLRRDRGRRYQQKRVLFRTVDDCSDRATL